MSPIPSFRIHREADKWFLKVCIGDAEYFIPPHQVNTLMETGMFPTEFSELAGIHLPASSVFSYAQMVTGRVEQAMLTSFVGALKTLESHEKAVLSPIVQLAIDQSHAIRTLPPI